MEMITNPAGSFFGLLSLVFPLGMILVWVFLLVIAWRFMRAHESIAATYKSMERMFEDIVGKMQDKQ